MPFDPSKPFKKVEETSGFDPSKPFKKIPEPKVEVSQTTTNTGPQSISKTEAGFRGAGQSFFGLGDEGEGLYKATAATLQGKPGAFSDLYRAERDNARLLNDQAWNEQKLAYGTGYVAGTGVQMAIPGLGVAKGVGVLGNMAKGAGMGLASTLGSTEADLTKGERPSATELAIGAGGGALAGGIGKGLANRAAGIAEEQAGLNANKAIRIAVREGHAPSGKDLLKKGLGWTAEGTEKLAKESKAVIGKEFNPILKKAGELLDEKLQTFLKSKNAQGPEAQEFVNSVTKYTTNNLSIADKIMSKADEIAKSPAKQGIANKMYKEAEKFVDLSSSAPWPKNLDPAALNKMKSDYGERIFNLARQLKGTEALDEVRKILKNQVAENLDNVKAGLGSKDLAALQKQYERASNLVDAVTARAVSGAKPDKLNLTDLVTTLLVPPVGLFRIGEKVAPTATAKIENLVAPLAPILGQEAVGKTIKEKEKRDKLYGK